MKEIYCRNIEKKKSYEANKAANFAYASLTLTFKQTINSSSGYCFNIVQMANILLRQKVIELRKQGKSYSEIKGNLSVSKSTLSDWLGKYPLTKEQIKKLEKSRSKSRDATIEKCCITKQKKREGRLKKTYKDERETLVLLTEKEIYLFGLFLYWGKGFKNLKGAISLSNTDPKVIKFFYFG